MSKRNAVVAVFDSHEEAEAAIRELDKSDFPTKQLSIVGRDYHTEEHVVGYYNMGDRVKYWGKLGAFWGGIWGLLFGSAFLAVPGIGPMVVGGPLVGWLIAGIENAVVVGGVSALGAALYSIGIPKDSIMKYETAVKVGKYVIIAHGTADEVAKARLVLEGTSPVDMATHEQC